MPENQENQKLTFLNIAWQYISVCPIMHEYESEIVSGEREGFPDSIVSLDNYADLDREYPASFYPKLASALTLRRAGLPTLPGYVIKKLDDEAVNFLTFWMAKTNAGRLSLRFDSSNPEDQVKMSSLNPTLEDLIQIGPLIKTPVIGIVLAENDRYQQDHSVLTYFLEDILVCEVVGPGFDAGDLTRGNTNSHEVVTIRRKTPDAYNFSAEITPIDIIDHKFITAGDYALSRSFRYGVIYATINKGLAKSVSPVELSVEQEKSVENFLTTRSASIPLGYEPLGFDKLSTLYKYLSALDTFEKYYKEKFNIQSRAKVLSASFLKKYGLIFWDFYGPDKYMSKRLSTK